MLHHIIHFCKRKVSLKSVSREIEHTVYCWHWQNQCNTILQNPYLSARQTASIYCLLLTTLKSLSQASWVYSYNGYCWEPLLYSMIPDCSDVYGGFQGAHNHSHMMPRGPSIQGGWLQFCRGENSRWDSIGRLETITSINGSRIKSPRKKKIIIIIFFSFIFL